MTGRYDLAVVGGGPAGVAGALTAALAGLSVVLVDSGARLGGQYFRHPAGAHPGTPGLDRFLRQSRALADRADLLLGHQAWAVEHTAAEHDGGFTLRCTAPDGSPVAVASRRLLIATGAHDRPLPFPGWDLPGVLTAGGAQALLKGNGVVAGRRIVVAGTGPFLLPVATGLAGAGADVLGVFEAGGGLGLARHPLLAAGKAGEAAGYALALARHRVPYRTRQAVVAAHGERELEAVTVARLDRDWNVLSTRRVACDTLATGYGFVPQIDLGVQLGCRTRADPDGSPVLVVDARQRTSVPGVWAAGEPAGVGGRELAELEGRIAGRTISAEHDPVPGAPARRRERLRAFARALLEAYPIRPGWQRWLRDDTLVCRCEEVPLARVREARELGATDARSVKLLSRAGMGWCQGRVCGHAVACLTGVPVTQPRRPLAQPVTLGALAALTDTHDPAGAQHPAGSQDPTGPREPAGGQAGSRAGDRNSSAASTTDGKDSA
ncbi:NADPH-dependent 2,4-dienoyl-CoA reductase/sulfur reductase-like enzyme [Nonomuraea muscovyensis]|uniref:NADPH-dependent 2,4-dienoyl-CoA reductase/sulfur reductase-like enzyme n=1 Tax=Nonomuraea muscovyensis TaxID=1124761 RepID=A0A7X0C4N5_9ACTN|nr:NAD(P)/FAD-dependent oxidoreductase [Nonomuraea muscovyensis]MBB6348448.1 NADPH-dependent 2,4-dienoyl-CoA reductase/sulfur reductase-like enzyme [Nonomuraea muscovyensis]